MKIKSLKNLQDVVLTLGLDPKNEEYFFHRGSFASNKPLRQEFNFFSIILCIENEVTLKINHVDYVLPPVTLMITKPGTIIEVVSNETAFQGVILFFSKDFIIKNVVNSDLFKPFRELEVHHFLKTELASEELENLLDIYKILDKRKDSPSTPIEIEVIKSAYFIMVCEVAEIFFRRKPDIASDQKRSVEIARKFQHLVKHTAQKRQPLKYYADQIFISEKYLIKAVRTSLGTTPKKVIDEAVTVQARHFLENPEISISQVAENLLFGDVSSFSKFFKAQTGKTPSEYRKGL